MKQFDKKDLFVCLHPVHFIQWKTIIPWNCIYFPGAKWCMIYPLQAMTKTSTFAQQLIKYQVIIMSIECSCIACLLIEEGFFVSVSIELKPIFTIYTETTARNQFGRNPLYCIRVSWIFTSATYNVDGIL